MKKFNKKIISLLLAMLMLTSIVPIETITAYAIDANAIRSQITRTYQQAKSIAGRSSFSGYCASYVQCQLAALGITSGRLSGYNGNNSYEKFCNMSKTSGGYYVKAYSGRNAVSNIANANGGNATNILVGFQTSPTEAGKKYGHVLFIHAIIDYTVYYSESFSSGGISEGSVRTKSVSAFNSAYSNYSWDGAIHFTRGTPTPPPPPAIPDKPSITSISATDVAVGKNVTINWNASARATSYNVAIRGAETKNIAVGSGTRSYTFTANKLGTYTIYIEAKNESGTSSNNNYKQVTTHSPVKVDFLDWDGTPLTSVNVNWGESAKAPVSPEREGYTFQGWSDSFYNVKSSKTIKATYKINTYTVNFYDKSDKLIKSEKVDYHNDATAPTDTNTPTGYEFMGWDSEDYKNVYTDASNKTINIHGIYQWSNEDLPIVANITTAKRQQDGYYVYFDLTNYPNAITRGRAVVSLKTLTGKLVDMTESAAFSIPKDTTKTGMEVFIPCDFGATNAEVIIVDSYSSGVPISEKVTATIDQGLMWSDWSTDQPDSSNPDLQIESRTEFRYRDKEKSTGNTKTKSGWTWDGTYTTSTGNWSAWQWNSISAYTNESTKREVQTQSAVKSYNQVTQYNYSRYKGTSGSKTRYGPCAGTWSSVYCGTYQERGWGGQLDCYGSETSNQYGGTFYKYNNYNDPWYNQNTRTVNGSANYATQYRYRDTNYTYNFYRWKDWTSWSTDSATATADKEVETRTTYRFKSNAAALEDESGEVRTISNQLDASLAGKQITLYVYKFDGSSDYTDEYIGQSVIEEDGTYSFTFKLREEPTVKTGDYTVAIGIEGTTNTQVIGIIEAPKPTYTVNFYDWDGTIIDTQTVVEGNDAVLPQTPTKEGYNFVGWDKSVANIKEDTDIFADFEKQQFTVVFVDWENQLVKVEKFNYGDALVAPDFTEIEGYTFKGWDQLENGNTIVTSDMVVAAQYEVNTYTVTFRDFDGNIISTQQVDYSKKARAPETVNESEDGKQFAGWFDAEKYENVKVDTDVYPAYYFEENANTPTVNYESGEYDDALTLELVSDDENAVIFFYINGDESRENIYTEPIVIDKTCSVSFYASSLGKNDSEISTYYYCINSADKPSNWMLYSELPDEVTENWQNYNLESDSGYRYKNTVETSSPSEADLYIADGWAVDGERYSNYTPWQDEEISIDNAKIGFEIDTQLVDDTTVTNYQYSHYKYIDENEEIQYSPREVEGYDCEYETVTVENRLAIAGFLEDKTSYYIYDNQMWFVQTKVNGKKTQYRSRYKIETYYKWTYWGIDAPSSNETRVYEADDVYRYSNKNYHIVTTIIENVPYPELDFIEDGKKYDVSKLAVEGYNIEGLYTDNMFNNRFDLNSGITESVTLYAKYTPKEYTVVFQMEDGTELDTQIIKYSEAAVAPANDIVPGYVFAGWDKDFDCVTEDLVVTGSYVKASEYAYITLDRTVVDLYKGTSVTLAPTITPDNLTSEKVEWTSSDPSIASVDENGVVMAVSEGEATITATVLSSKESATCVVTVVADLKNNIVLKESSNLNYDDLGYLRRVGINTNAGTVTKEFENKSSNLRFFNISGTELGNNDIVGTGSQIRLYNGDTLADSKTIVVTGDMTGDGIINNRDVAMFNRYLVNKVTVEDYQALAVDVNGDGYINNRDAAMIARYLVGKDNF